MIEIEHNPNFILLGLNITTWEDDDGGEGTFISIGLLFININIIL